MAIIYGLKVNLSVAIVGMVNHTGVELMALESLGENHTTHHVVINPEDDCSEPSSGNSTDDGGGEVRKFFYYN